MSRPTCRVRPKVFAASPLRLSNIPLTPGRQWLMAQCGRADRRGDLIGPSRKASGRAGRFCKASGAYVLASFFFSFHFFFLPSLFCLQTQIARAERHRVSSTHKH